MTDVCNQIILTGKVVTPPRRHYRPDGSPVIQFLLALNEGDTPSEKSVRNVINIVAFGEWPESKRDLLQNGLSLKVIGRLNQREWLTPEGKRKTRTEVIATDLLEVQEEYQTPCFTKSKTGSIKRGEKNEETY
jgi:single-strand DNA-binding protein